MKKMVYFIIGPAILGLVLALIAYVTNTVPAHLPGRTHECAYLLDLIRIQAISSAPGTG